MKLDCGITELIRGDFNALWKCRQSGETLEITTPYLMPDSTLFSVFLTKRNDRYIVCDGGGLSELLAEYCPLPADELKWSLEDMARKFQMKQGEISGEPLFFKECSEPKLISSLVFDVANFATSSANALVALSGEEATIEPEHRFQTKADKFVRTMKPSGWEIGKREIDEVPGFQFGAVLHRASKLCLIAYVTGKDSTYFRRSVNDTAKSFEHAWRSSLAANDMIYKTIPLINTEAAGYKPDKLKWQLDELKKDAHGSYVPWTEKDRLVEMMS